jgi:hypothetical protein
MPGMVFGFVGATIVNRSLDALCSAPKRRIEWLSGNGLIQNRRSDSSNQEALSRHWQTSSWLRAAIQSMHLRNYICEWSVLMYGRIVVGSLNGENFTSILCFE